MEAMLMTGRLNHFKPNRFLSYLFIFSILFSFQVPQFVSAKDKTTSDKSSQIITVRSIGDILLHDYVYQNAQTETGYDFDYMFEEVAPYISHADISIANLETIAAGDDLGVSTYPFFNAPNSIVTSLKNIGIDIVNNATNHTMDRGVEGALASITNLKRHKMPYVGSYESWDDYNDLRIIDVKGTKVGFLSYTYGLNGNYLPEDQTYLATLIDKELIPLEIKRLNEHADISVVIFHEGEEYEHYPNDNQLALFDLAKEAGANFVLGGHPHVVQPGVVWNKSQGGIFSHANFLSGQVDLYTKIGGIWEFEFAVDQKKNITLNEIRMMPTYCQGYPEYNIFKVVPLVEADSWAVGDVDALMTEMATIVESQSDKVKVVDYLSTK